MRHRVYKFASNMRFGFPSLALYSLIRGATLCFPSIMASTRDSSPPNLTLLKEVNTVFNAQVLGGKLLDFSTQKHSKNLAYISKCLAAQVTILRKENKKQELILKKRKK